MNFIQTPFMILVSSTLITSTLMAISSSNWLFLWASMELNLLSFIPIILSTKQHQEAEGSIKYFLAQAFGSALLLMSSTNLWMPFTPFSNMMPLILTTSILMKLGSVPCHFWYPSVMSSISWTSCLILSSWQKIAPLCIMAFILQQKSHSFLMLVAGLNAIIGGMMGMNQSQLRTIMAYSSIGHIGWMIALITLNKPTTAMLYFTIYIMLITPLFSMFYMLNSMTTKQMSKTVSYSVAMQTTIILLLLSLAGLPPLTGFMPKLMTIYLLSSNNMTVVLLLIAGSIMNLYFYLNIAISSIMFTNHTMKNTSLKMNQMHTLAITGATSTIGMTPFIMFLYAMTMFNKS